jgi:hypothetical protein
MSEFGNGGESSLHLLHALLSKIDGERPNPGQSGGGRRLTRVSPRVLLLDRLIGNFLERVLVCVFFILLLLLFCGRLLVAFLAELATTATTLALSHLGVRRHRQHHDYRSYHKGSHLDGSLPPRNAQEVDVQIAANLPPRFSEPATGFETGLRVQGAHPLEISWKGFMRLSDSLKSGGFVARMHASAKTAPIKACVNHAF